MSQNDAIVIENRWDESKAQGMSEPELLLYRSNILGSDLKITNYGGGNTSAKVTEKDPLTGQDAEVLYVKGSGGDVGSMKMDGFATLYMNKLIDLKNNLYRGLEHEDEMVGMYPHCTFNLNPRASSIDTPLHAYIPYAHVDHMHPDALIAIAACKDGQEISKEIFGDTMGWIEWQRPGFDLGLKLEKMSRENRHYRGIILGGHGLFTWGNTSKECYDNTIEVIQMAHDYLASKESGESFGGQKYQTLPEDKRLDVVRKIMPAMRGKLSKENRKVGHYNASAEVLEYVNSNNVKELAALGTSCPDHFLRTKIRPLLLEIDPATVDIDSVIASLDDKLEDYRKDYEAYYERCKRDNSPAVRDPYPVIVLIPGVGMLSFAKDKATARIAGEFYVNAVNVMKGATTVSEYVALPEQEAFDIEYWLLEEAKLQRMPKPKDLAAQIAFITGGAGGIGKATAHKLLEGDACVVLADINQDALDKAVAEFHDQYGKDKVRGVICNVTDEQSVADALKYTVAEYGGVDILVSNAGISSSSPFEETTLETWNKNMQILATGYFLVSRESFKVMKEQGLDGSIVFIASKNGLVASTKAAAYCTAKASEIQLARCLALEGADHGIRANVINPDAVLRGSSIWQGSWRKERAEAYGIKEDELEDFYKKRSMLKRGVYPEDIAEGVYFFASNKSYKSTGNILNVDCGHAPSFTR